MHCSAFNQNHKLEFIMHTKPANYCGQSPFKATSLPYNSWNFNFKTKLESKLKMFNVRIKTHKQNFHFKQREDSSAQFSKLQ